MRIVVVFPSIGSEEAVHTACWDRHGQALHRDPTPSPAEVALAQIDRLDSNVHGTPCVRWRAPPSGAGRRGVRREPSVRLEGRDDVAEVLLDVREHLGHGD